MSKTVIRSVTVGYSSYQYRLHRRIHLLVVVKQKRWLMQEQQSNPLHQELSEDLLDLVVPLDSFVEATRQIPCMFYLY